MMLFTFLAISASILLFAAGWLAGVRRAKPARDELRNALDELQDALDDAERRADALVSEKHANEDSRALQDTVRAVLGPIAARERIGLELSTLDPRSAATRNLPELLDEIARRSGLGTMLLSDEVGLPLASTTTSATEGIDGLAAMSALLLNLVDRIDAAGSPAPLSAVLRDEANQVLLHRVFRVGSERFVLSASTTGRAMTPDDLDPALNRVVQALLPQAAAL